MKILVLMPLDEKWIYMANGIYNALPVETRERTFVMPMFMQYCITTKIADNWAYAVYDAVVAAKKVYETATNAKDDLIIIGNCAADLEFDAVFNFQDLEEDLPYEDKYIEKLRLVVKEDEDLTKWLVMHEAEESKMSLHNCRATADFLDAYLKTDPHIDEIREMFKDKLDFNDK